MKRLLILFALCASAASAQGVRFTSQVLQQGTIVGTTNAVLLPTVSQIAFCASPANAVPCTNKATTYTSATLATPCSTSTQIVLDGTTSCVANVDSQNNWGVWAPPGQYAYTITLTNGTNLGPYFVTLSLPTNPNVPVTFSANLNNPAWVVGNCLQEGPSGPVTTSGPCGVSGGSITGTGSPVAGQGSFFSGASSITGSPNWLYSAGSGHSVIQGANNTDAFFMQRFTDVAPTGNFLHFRNAALNADLFKLDIAGNLTAAGTGTFSGGLPSPVITTPTINGASTGTGVQGNASKLLTDDGSGGAGSTLCRAAGGGSTTAGCSASSFKIENVNTSPVTVNNTAAETNLQNFTLGVNELAAGQVLRITGRGNYTTSGTGATTTLHVRVRFDSTLVYDGFISFANASPTPGTFEVNANIACVTSGGGGTVEGEGSLTVGDQTSLILGANAGGSLAFDTTASHVIKITAQWSIANSNNTITERFQSTERLN